MECVLTRAAMLTIKGLYDILQRQGSGLLETLTIEECFLFVRLASRLKRRILHTQKADWNEDTVPLGINLPPAVVVFLGNSLSWTRSQTMDCWDILGQFVWQMDEPPIVQQHIDDLGLFRRFGHSQELGQYTSCHRECHKY